jgi:hypothetical protein
MSEHTEDYTIEELKQKLALSEKNSELTKLCVFNILNGLTESEASKELAEKNLIVVNKMISDMNNLFDKMSVKIKDLNDIAVNIEKERQRPNPLANFCDFFCVAATTAILGFIFCYSDSRIIIRKG